MAFASTVAWEIQTGGDDNNGGGFDATSGTPGTDYSQQTSPQVTFTDLVIDGTTNTKATSAGNPFTSAHVGNIINITSGTGFTVQRVQIMSVAAGVATMDKSLGTLGSTGGNGKLGGCLLTWAQAALLTVAGNTVWIKSGTYTVTTTIAYAVAGSAGKPIRWIGYETTRGDNTGTRPVLTSATTSVSLISPAVGFHHFRNIKFTHTGSTRGYGFRFITSLYLLVVSDCEFDGVLSAVKGDNIGFEYPMYGEIVNCWSHNCTEYGFRIGMGIIKNCLIEDNAGGGIFVGLFTNGQTDIENNIIVNNTGDGINAVYVGNQRLTIKNNTIAGNSSDGVDDTAGYGVALFHVFNNIFDSNGGYGLNLPLSYRSVNMINNAYRNNTSGARSATVPAGEGDITLTADPFTDSASGDWSLNNTAGGGAALRGLSYPAATLDGLTDMYVDIGAVQHQDSGGGGGLLTHPGMSGGMRG